MRTPPRYFPGLLACLALATTLVASAADTARYRPPLGPHFTAGQVFSYSADADYSGLFRSIKDQNRINDDGSNSRAEKALFDMSARFSINFVADSVLARQVFKNGSLREAVFQVSSCRIMQEKASLPPLVPVGGVLTLQRQKDGHFDCALNGKTVTSELAEQLQKVNLPPNLVPPGSMLTVRKQPSGQVIFSLDGRLLPSDASAQLQEKDAVQTLLPAGAILVARKQKDGQVAFAVNGQPADLTLAEKLSVVIELGNEDATNDDLFSPAQPVAVGDNWDINLKAVLNSDLPQCFPGLSSVVGSVSLVDVRTDKNGRQRGVVASTYSLIGVQPPFKREFKSKPSTVSFKVVATTPIAGGPGLYDLQLKSLVRHAASTGDANVGFAESNVEFSITIEQNIHYNTETQRPAVAVLSNAPAAPDAPSLPPGLSAANIYRPPIEWIKKEGAPKPADTVLTTGAPAPTSPAASSPAASKPAPTAAPAPFIMPDSNVSPFGHAQDPLAKPGSK